MSSKFLIGCCMAMFLVSAAQALPVINEFVLDHTGSDTKEFIEIFGAPNTDYSDYWIVEIEGDSSAAGLIDDATYQLGTTDANGIWWTGFVPNVPENGTVTLLLVTEFIGSVGDDVDPNNEGAITVPFWDSIVDSVASSDGGSSDHVYGVDLFPGFDSLNTFQTGGASRIPDGTDTDTTADWVRNDFDGYGFGAPFTGSQDPGEARNTPGALNAVIVPEPASLALMAFGLAGIALRRRS